MRVFIVNKMKRYAKLRKYLPILSLRASFLGASSVEQPVLCNLRHQAVDQFDGGATAIACRFGQAVFGALLVRIACNPSK